MSLDAACGWTLLRSLAIALAATLLCRCLVASLAARRGLAGAAGWSLLVVPFFTPELLTGYAYANFSLGLVRHPVWNELFYAALVFMKTVPVGTLLLYFAPPPALGAQSLYCARLAERKSGGLLERLSRRSGFSVRGPLRSAIPAFAVMFLIAFQEFEMASAMGATAWTVWLFDQQAGGLALSESLKKSVLPMGYELAIVIPALLLTVANGRFPSVPQSPHFTARRWRDLPVACYLGFAGVVVALIPLWVVLKQTAAGFSAVWRNSTFSLSVVTSGSMALVAGLCAFWLGRVLLPIKSMQRFAPLRLGVAAVCCAPGLLGTLILGLVLLWLFQFPLFSRAYNSPAPLLILLILYLLPRALLLHLLLRAVRPQEPVFLAEALASARTHRKYGRELLWQLRLRGAFWACVLLCFWAYLDVTATALLRPVGMESAPVLLYNLMHYGQSAVLSAMLFATIAVPLALVLSFVAVRRHFLPWIVR